MAYAFRRVAPALDTLLAQLNALAPRRSRKSDGALGDQAHAARFSFHNPNFSGVVQARDFAHDPAGGLDCNWLAAALTASGDKRIHEIIWNRRYWTPRGGWVPYYGTNPHDKHLHLTVRSDPKLYNSTAPWDLSGGVTSTPDALTEEDFLSALSDEEQRRLLEWADKGLYMLPVMKEQTDMIPAAAVAVGEIRWGVLDEQQGLRVSLSALFAKIAASDAASGVTAADIAALIPQGLASEVADELQRRLSA